MSDKTVIAWTDHTFNIAWGCQKVSAGCKHCYADTMSAKYGYPKLWGPGSERRTFGKTYWAQPLKWNRDAEASGVPAKVFCSSMCDVFEDHPTIDAEREKLWPLIRSTPHLQWQLLTKRPSRIAANLPADWGEGYPNVWLGTSIENNLVADRADHLKAIPAVVRFISYEPALGPIDEVDLTGMDWIIVGGESGSNYRPMDLAWVRDVRARCDELNIAFFFKQSAAPYTEMGTTLDGEIVRAYPTPRKSLIAA